MAVTHTSWGFAGTVDEIAEAKRLAILGPPFRVRTVNDWVPTVSGSVSRSISVSAGVAQACGVGDSTTAADGVDFAANTGGSDRYDLLLATWDWAGSEGRGARTVTFRALQGTTTPPLVNGSFTSIDPAKVNRIPGVQYDAVLGVVRVRPGVGLFTSGDFSDCRVWGGYEGYGLTGSATFLNVIDTQPGALLKDTSTGIVWERVTTQWYVHSWAGTDKNAQPMIALHNAAFPIVNNTFPQVASWPLVVDHSRGLFALISQGKVQCNAWGKVRLEAHAYSQLNSDGNSFMQVSYPAGGGNYFTTLSDQRYRNGLQPIRQTLTAGPVVVAPNDIFDMQVFQNNIAGSTINYSLYLSLTYV